MLSCLWLSCRALIFVCLIDIVIEFYAMGESDILEESENGFHVQ